MAKYETTKICCKCGDRFKSKMRGINYCSPCKEVENRLKKLLIAKNNNKYDKPLY